jgi:hypothetical protein
MASFLLAAGPAAAQDAREPAARTAAERVFILGQMRLFLGSVQAITAALPAGDMKTVTAEAAARGRRGTPASDIPPTLKAKETPSWTAMMGGARKGFDDIAAAAESPGYQKQGTGLKHGVPGLSATAALCVFGVFCGSVFLVWNRRAPLRSVNASSGAGCCGRFDRK